MFEMDKYIFYDINKLIKISQLNYINKTKKNSLWKSYQHKAPQNIKKAKLIKHKKKEEENYNLYMQKSKNYKVLQLQTPSNVPTKKNFELIYIRYPGGWILGITGLKHLTIYIKNKINSYLQYYLKLKLSEEKTSITNIKTGSVNFLGFNITITNKNTRILRVPTKRFNK